MTLTNNDSSSSDSLTCNNENSILTDNEFNMKMPAVVRKKSSLTTKVSDTVKIDVPEDSDGSGSASLLKKNYIPLSDMEDRRCFGTVLLQYSTPFIIWKYTYITT